MADTRAILLKARREASRLHRDLGTREAIEQSGGRVDVFGSIVKCAVPLLFRPLDGLLGVFVDEPMPGVLITTKRNLAIQRFTGAHELGHFHLRHKPSFDDEPILARSPFTAAAGYDQQELEANAFATEFMLPPWLLINWRDRHSNSG